MIKNTIKVFSIIFLTLLTFSGFSSNNITYNLTGTFNGNFNGNGIGITNNQPPEVQGMFANSPVGSMLWMDMSQVVATNNNQPLSSVPDFSGDGLTLFSGTATPPLYLDAAHGFGSRPSLYMEANWNPVTGASPTISYALTNRLQFGNTNYSITLVYQLELPLGGSGTSPELNGGQSQYLFQDGNFGSATLGFAFYTQSFENMNGCSYSQLASTAQIAALPLQYRPMVVTFRLQNGYQDEFINGVQVALTNTAAFSYGTSSGNIFSLGNPDNNGVIIPSFGAFCGLMSEVLVTSSNAPSTLAILAYHSELMKKYNFGGGIWINLVGDSITFGTLGLYPINLYGLTQSTFPNCFVSDVGMSGEASSPIYTATVQTQGVRPYNTSQPIDVCMFGVNDNLQGSTLANWETNVINTANLKHSQGHLVDWCTLPSFNGESNTPTRASMNAFLYANTNLFDALVDYASDKLMGTNGSCVVESNLYNEVFAPIGIHPLSAGYQELCTNWLFPVLQKQIYGINGISVYNHIPNSVSVGSSPWNFTNTLNNGINCFITDSATYSVALNGQTIYNVSGASLVPLASTNILTITYLSTAPTMTTNSYP